MDNREFAQVLLSEAASLLEGAQAEAYKAKKAKEKEENNRKPSNKRFPTTYDSKGEMHYHEPGDRAKHYYTGEKDEKTGQRLYYTDDKDIEKNKEDHKRASKVYNKLLSERERRNDAEDEVISKYKKLKAQYGENVPGYDALNKEYKKRRKNTNNVYGDNALYALDAMNRHMRRHYKKSQNESIAVLLTEAALLLNEGARYRKEIKDCQGDTSYKIGKHAAKLYAKKDNLGGIIWNTAGKLVASNIKYDIDPDSTTKSLNATARYMTGEMSDDEKKEYERKEKSKELHDKINNK